MSEPPIPAPIIHALRLIGMPEYINTNELIGDWIRDLRVGAHMAGYRKGVLDAFKSLGEEPDERMMLLTRAESDSYRE